MLHVLEQYMLSFAIKFCNFEVLHVLEQYMLSFAIKFFLQSGSNRAVEGEAIPKQYSTSETLRVELL